MQRMNLRQARKQRGLTKAFVADMLCIPKETLESWESGVGSPEIVQGLYIAMLYNTDLSTIDFSLEVQRA